MDHADHRSDANADQQYCWHSIHEFTQEAHPASIGQLQAKSDSDSTLSFKFPTPWKSDATTANEKSQADPDGSAWLQFFGHHNSAERSNKPFRRAQPDACVTSGELPASRRLRRLTTTQQN